MITKLSSKTAEVVELAITSRKQVGGFWGREVRLRWSDKLQGMRGTPLPAVRPRVTRNEMGNVVLLMDPVPQARRRRAYQVRAQELRISGVWWYTSFMLFEDEADHADALAMLPAAHGIQPTEFTLTDGPDRTLVVLLAKAAQPREVAKTPENSGASGDQLAFGSEEVQTLGGEESANTGAARAEKQGPVEKAAMAVYRELRMVREQLWINNKQHMEAMKQPVRDCHRMAQAVESLAASFHRLADSRSLPVTMDAEQEARLRESVQVVADCLVNGKD